jgi:Tetratricopeptide repeat
LGGARRYERYGALLSPAVLSRADLAACHAELGTFAQGIALGDEALRIAEAINSPGSLKFALWGFGLVFLYQGDFYRALPPLERAVGICHKADLPVYFP